VPHTRVLLVDDHEMVTESFTRALEAEGDVDVVGVAVTVSEAVAAATELRPAVVVMDDRLPDGNGAAAATRIIEQVPEAKVLLLVSRGEPIALPDALGAGRVGFLEKASAFGSLPTAIRALARGDVAPSSEQRFPLVTRTDRRDERPPLTRREREVLGLMVEGLSNPAIAERLTLSIHTVRTHVQAILRKLDVHSKLEAVGIAARLGYVASARGTATR
jgi:two-component system response regulator DevR